MHNYTETDDMDLLSTKSDVCDDGDSVTLGSDYTVLVAMITWITCLSFGTIKYW